MIHFHIISLFPESIKPYLDASMIGRAQKDGKLAIHYYNPRDFTEDKHKRVDRKPYGGGPGMVLEAPSVLSAVQAATKGKRSVEVVFFTPSGAQFTQDTAREFASGSTKKVKHIVLLCAHYEGLDARVPEILKARHISVGPFVLTGGELPAALVIDATARHIKGVLGKEESREEERTASSEVYTRPEVIRYKGKKYAVPKVLLSGDHKKIEEWRHERKSMV